MAAEARPQPSSPFRECTLRAIVLTPERPIANWLVQLDRSVQQNQGSFLGRAVLLDVSALRPKQVELKTLLARLHKRNIRIMAVEGTDPAWLGPGMPPLVNASPQTNIAEPVSISDPPARAPVPHVPARVIEGAVRSGQSIVFPEGDLTIIGSVSSGAEVVAGGSIHIYGALRGRAVAGSTAISRRASSAASSKPSFWPSTAITKQPTTSRRMCSGGRRRPGLKATQSGWLPRS